MELKRLVFILFVAIALPDMGMAARNFHSFKVEDIDGKVVSMKTFKGKKVVVVNVASRCGLTPEYKQLQALYLNFKDKGLIVLGFPANNFKQQEPGTNAEIHEFCTREYRVTFPMMSKISVKGEDMHPLYRWLTLKVENGRFDAPVKWNFQKYFIDEKGNLVGFMESGKNPDYEKIGRWVDTGKYE